MSSGSDSDSDNIPDVFRPRVKVERKEYLDTLKECLQRVNGFGTFSIGRECEAPNPGLTIEGIGLIAFPLLEVQAIEIKNKSSLAPFGMREQTITDTSVRRTWQLNPTTFHTQNPKWSSYLEENLLPIIKDGLGIREEIQASVYKLLLYETGSFFLTHRDSEKENGMFGSLIIQLPSIYTGGSLIVKHQKKERVFDFSNDNFSSHFAAFYCDCEHEVLPITSGYRLCLVYNLVHAGPHIPSFADTSGLVEEISQILQTYQRDDGGAPAISFLLDHHYTQAGLSFKGLKNGDRMKAEALWRACAREQCDVFLAIATKYEQEMIGWEEDGELPTIYNTRVELGNWIDVEDDEVDFNNMEINIEGQIANYEKFDDVKVDVEKIKPTGNDGDAAHRWYRQAVLVVMDFHSVYFQRRRMLGNGAAVEEFVEMVEDGRWNENATEKNRCVQYGEVLLPNCVADPQFQQTLLETVLALDYPPLFQQFLENAQPLQLSLCSLLLKGYHQFGVEAFEGVFKKWFESNHLERALAILWYFVGEKNPDFPQREERLNVCHALAALIVDYLLKEKDATIDEVVYKVKPAKSEGMVTTLFKSLFSINSPHLQSVCTHICASPNYYLFATMQAVRNIYHWLKESGLERREEFVQFVQSYVECMESVPEPESPKSWINHLYIKCACEKCEKVKTFLRDPTKKQFKVQQNYFSHTQMQADKWINIKIDDNSHSGNLILHKTNKAYTQRKELHKKLPEWIEELKRFVETKRRKVK